MVSYKIKLTEKYENLQSIKFHPLTTNGPYIDAHFGPLTEKTPVGQTYFIRPETEYVPPCKNGKKNGCGCGGKDQGYLLIKLQSCYPSVHANTNSVSTDFSVSGNIKISPFQFNGNVAKVFPNQKIVCNINVKNKTGLQMQGLHIHDGQLKNGLTSFGPISYFLYTTPVWNDRYNTSAKSVKFAKKYAPLPPQNIAPKHPELLLKYSTNKHSSTKRHKAKKIKNKTSKRK